MRGKGAPSIKSGINGILRPSADANEVVGIVEPLCSSRITGVNPAVSDQGEQHGGFSNGLAQPVVEIHAGRDAVDVHEHGVAAESRFETVENAARDGL